MKAIAKEIGLAQTLSVSRIITKLQEIHKSESTVLEAALPTEKSLAEETPMAEITETLTENNS